MNGKDDAEIELKKSLATGQIDIVHGNPAISFKSNRIISLSDRSDLISDFADLLERLTKSLQNRAKKSNVKFSWYLSDYDIAGVVFKSKDKMSRDEQFNLLIKGLNVLYTNKLIDQGQIVQFITYHVQKNYQEIPEDVVANKIKMGIEKSISPLYQPKKLYSRTLEYVSKQGTDTDKEKALNKLPKEIRNHVLKKK